jgi:hypothetical protein
MGTSGGSVLEGTPRATFEPLIPYAHLLSSKVRSQLKKPKGAALVIATPVQYCFFGRRLVV